jgi:Tfp pilus assembly protein PilO
MKGRDRLVLMGIIVVAVLGGAWMFVVSPERQKASSLGEQVTAARTQLTAAEGELSKARSAQAQYSTAYAAMVSIGKAVPASSETPSLMFEVADAAEHKHVEFNSITTSSPAGGASAATASATTTGFSPMPFTFSFNGSFFDLERLFSKLTSFATITSSGGVDVNGRLLTIQSVSLTGNTAAQQASTASASLTGSVTATAYVLPGGQSATAGASPAGPAGTAPASSTPGATSSATAPATATVNP